MWWIYGSGEWMEINVSQCARKKLYRKCFLSAQTAAEQKSLCSLFDFNQNWKKTQRPEHVNSIIYLRNSEFVSGRKKKILLQCVALKELFVPASWTQISSINYTKLIDKSLFKLANMKRQKSARMYLKLLPIPPTPHFLPLLLLNLLVELVESDSKESFTLRNTISLSKLTNIDASSCQSKHGTPSIIRKRAKIANKNI